MEGVLLGTDAFDSELMELAVNLFRKNILSCVHTDSLCFWRKSIIEDIFVSLFGLLEFI